MIKTLVLFPFKVSSRLMSRFILIHLLSWFFMLPVSTVAYATTSQFGNTGLLSQPTAQTLNEGNICVGIWANCSDGIDNGSALSGDSSLIIPVTITMGLGTFMEAYGSYPNLLFNGDEDGSGRGFANAGFKFRVHGKRSDRFRLAFDLQGRRSISDDPVFDGLTDYVGRFITSVNWDTFGIHANIGYALNDSPDTVDYDDQVLLGGGVEYSLATRLKLLAEISLDTEKVAGLGAPGEATAGFQYFITPHLTMNLGSSIGLSDASPDWRVILGLSTCQGVGTFNRPVTKLVETDDVIDEPEALAKISKIKILTPLISRVAVAKSPTSHLEIPINDPTEAIIIDPSDRLMAPEVNPLGASPIDPMGGLVTAEAIPLPKQSFPAKVLRRFRFPEVTYDFNQWDLSEEGRRSISLVAEELRKENKYFIISIEGHTDDVGSEAYNQSLSFRRAVAAATHLVLRDGFDPARIFVKGYGETRPIGDNTVDEGRALNRRVELLILVPQGYDEVELEIKDSGRKTVPSVQADKSTLIQDVPPIDPLAIEQVIMEKTGAETAKPVGAFSQID
jgi:hypothetical protein